jgi:hypothetical protein
MDDVDLSRTTRGETSKSLFACETQLNVRMKGIGTSVQPYRCCRHHHHFLTTTSVSLPDDCNMFVLGHARAHSNGESTLNDDCTRSKR